MQSSADSAATEKNGGDSRAQQKSGPPQQPQQQHHSGGGGATFQPHFPFANGHSTSAASSLVPHHHGFMAGPPETMQAFANLGLFCTPAGAHPQFPMATPSGGGGAALPPQLAAAAAAAAGYSQRLMGAQLPTAASQNGGLLRRNGFPGQHQTASSSSVPPHPSAASSSSINRSQRCGVCRGCQCKPCGQCTYCQDSPQFGGPGVKKQSCIERRCLRVLENRLQRDAPTFKARIGCNACEDCRSPDCQICLVCLDRRFFHSKYMAGALCAKKRCNNATALELPISSDRSSLKRTSDYGTAQHLAKRQILIPGTHPSGAQQLNSNIARILSAASDQQSQQKFGPAFGRCSGANSGNSSNSSLSEGQSTTPPSLMAVPQLGRHFWQGQMPSQMLLPGQYHFDAQMASLAAVAVGFPQHHGMTQHYAHPYQPKLLSAGYPKYEYLDEGTAVAMTNGPSTADSTGNGADGQMGGMQSNAGTAENLLVPPSYSDVQKVVLQPL